MSRISPPNLRVLIFAEVLALAAGSSLAQKNAGEPPIHAASIGHSITLHYVDEGTGVPVIFVHGSLSDGGSIKLGRLPSTIARSPTAADTTTRIRIQRGPDTRL